MQYILSFLKYLQYEKRGSHHTVTSYECDLLQFYQYLNPSEEQGGWSSVTPKQIRQWMVQLHNNGLKPRSVNRKIATLRSFFKYLMRQGLMEKNPAEQLITPKVPKLLPSFVKEKEMDMLLDGIEFGNDYAGFRNRMIIDLFYGTGIRLSELTNLQLSNIDLSGGVIKVTGKRNKDRIVPLHQSLLKAMPLYIEQRNQFLGSTPSTYLFLTDAGNPLYSKFVYRLVKQYLSAVTTLAKKSPHVLRHTFATALLNRGADLNAIKELLGHANLAATEIYTHTTFAQLNAIYKQAHPRA